MKKTLKQQILEALSQEDGFVASGSLQRREFPKYAYGERRGLHTPRSVVRRCEELTEEGKLVVSYNQNHAHYALKEKAPQKERFIYKVIDGTPYKIQVA